MNNKNISLDRVYGGTFLPEVAKEQEWDQHTTLNFLVRKAGFNGRWELVKESLRVVRYQSIKIFMTHDEYEELKNSKMDIWKRKIFNLIKVIS